MAYFFIIRGFSGFCKGGEGTEANFFPEFTPCAAPAGMVDCFSVMRMRKIAKLRRSIETMPRPAYIFLKGVLILACVMLLGSSLLFALGGGDPDRRALAQLLLESPAGVLMLGVVGLALLLDRLE